MIFLLFSLTGIVSAANASELFSPKDLPALVSCAQGFSAPYARPGLVSTDAAHPGLVTYRAGVPTDHIGDLISSDGWVFDCSGSVLPLAPGDDKHPAQLEADEKITSTVRYFPYEFNVTTSRGMEKHSTLIACLPGNARPTPCRMYQDLRAAREDMTRRVAAGEYVISDHIVQSVTHEAVPKDRSWAGTCQLKNNERGQAAVDRLVVDNLGSLTLLDNQENPPFYTPPVLSGDAPAQQNPNLVPDAFRFAVPTSCQDLCPSPPREDYKSLCEAANNPSAPCSYCHLIYERKYQASNKNSFASKVSRVLKKLIQPKQPGFPLSVPSPVAPDGSAPPGR